MYREITNKLIKWKNTSRRKPLLLTGVRQCGKTYVIEEFGQNHFKNYVCVNFEASEKAAGIFDYDLDPDRILSEFETYTKETITPGETLLFFDEIQECPRAITALKYFCENKRNLHVVCAGSLLGVAVKKEGISFPVGKVNRLQLHPMNFKEFVIANGQEKLIDLFQDWPIDREIPEVHAAPMRKLLKEFYVVGGMPEAVKTWTETHDFDAVEDVQKEILNDYADDFAKHAPLNDVPKIRWIWDSVPVQLAKDNNKFVFSHVRAGKRSVELEDALQWLADAGLIIRTSLVEKPELPLSGFADETYFKVYMSDIGLLRARSKVTPETIMEETELYKTYRGAFVENYVLNELIALGKEPYFWRSGNTAEVDFVYDDKGSIIPVEVKSADNTQAKSYKQFCKRYKPAFGFKLSEKNIGKSMCEKTETFSLPLYLNWNLEKYYV